MVKQIEELTGKPVVQCATIVPIMLTVGANRMVPGVAIPHPVGDPSKNEKEEYELRKSLVLRALNAATIEIKEQTVF